MTRARHDERGLSLVELLVGVVLLSLVTGALSTAFITAINGDGPTRQRVRESNDAQVIAGFLVRDAQAAGGVNPSTGTPDPNLGVVNPAEGPASNFGCAGPAGATLELGFTWKDRSVDSASGTQVATTVVANYYLVTATHELDRVTCTNGGSPSTLPVGKSIGSVVPTCNPACTTTPSQPDTVSLTITETNSPQNAPAPFTYTLTASLRPEDQTMPTSATGSAVPLLALGGSAAACAAIGAAGVDVGGSVDAHVYGNVVINTTDAGCPAMHYHPGGGSYTSGVIDMLAGGTCSGNGCPGTSSYGTALLDPWAGLTPPPNTCGSGVNPSPTSIAGVLHYPPGTYPTLLSISGGTVVFDNGVFVFCNGLSLSGGTISTAAAGALLYFKGGTLTKTGGANVTLTGIASGDYAGLAIWQDAADTTSPMDFAGNGPLTIAGTVYAPSIVVVLEGTAGTTIESIVAGAVSFSGNHQVSVGNPPPQLTITGPASLPNWSVNVAYPVQTITVTGGSGINNWTASGLPPGLVMNAVTAQISGTPTTVGSYTVTVTDTDSFGDVASKVYSLTINPPPTITTGSLPNWTINRDYPGTAMTVSGGTGPFTWSATGLPAGLAINANTGVITGTPSATGTSTVVVTVVDAAGLSATRNYTVVINPVPAVTGPGSLPNWTVNRAYPSQTATATGGTTPYTWSATGLPAGMSINAGSGVIAGTPSVVGTFTATVTVTDVAGAAASRTFTFTINPGPGIATSALRTGEQNVPYNFTLTATGGGTPPYTWSATGLPANLTINASSGVISGTPTAAGTFSPVKITITDATGASSSTNYNLTIAAPIVVNNVPLPNWTVNRDYPGTQMTSSNGVAPVTWTATGLPPGMTISATGLVSGTPSATGTYSVSVTANDAAGGSNTRPYTLVINAPPAITTGSLPAGTQTVAYNTTMTATNGTAPRTWTASGLPAGLAINPSTGVISGTPTAGGNFSVTITVVDTAGASDAKIYTLTVNPAPAPTGTNPPSLPQGATNQDVTINGTSFVSGATVAFSGTGITVNSVTFVDSAHVVANVTIAGNATTGARTITVTNPDGGQGTVGFTVNPKPTITTVNPNARGQGAANQNVTITGTNFVNGASVAFSGTGITINTTTFVNATQLTVNISVASNAATGARNVTVTNPDGGTATATNGFTVNAGLTVTAAAPNARGQGATNQTITATGTGFVSGATVTFSGGADITVVSTTFVNATTLTVKINVAGNSSVGAHDITVTNPDQGTSTAIGAFTVNGGPTITTPNAGAPASVTHSTTTNVAIVGAGFVTGAAVTISGGFTVNSVTFVDGNQLTVNVTAGSNGQRGTYDLTVTNPDGGSFTATGAITNT